MPVRKLFLSLVAVVCLWSTPASADACLTRNQQYAASAQIICNEPGLNNVDRQLFEALRDFASTKLTEQHATEFNALLAEWLTERGRCGDVACMQEYYTRTVPIWFDIMKKMTGVEA